MKSVALYGTCKHLEWYEPIELDDNERMEVECQECKKSWVWNGERWLLIKHIEAHD